MLTTRRGLVALAALGMPAVARAQNPFPSRTLRMIVPYAPGGAGDITARILADGAPAVLGQSIAVENRTGANGVVGAEAVARAAPDGYTLGLVVSSHVINQAVLPNLPFDPVTDFQPVIMTARTQMVLVAAPQLGVSTVRELVEYVKARPGQLAFASAGTGSNVHVFLEWFARRSGMQAVHIPYRGSAAAHPDLLGGRVAFTIDTYAAVRQYVEQGQMRLLAFGGPNRSVLRPDVPTIAEETGIAGYEANSWGGVLAPAGTPEPVVRRLNEAFARHLRTPATRERLLGLGAELVAGTAEEFRAVMVEDAKRYAALVKEFDIRQGT